MLVAPRCHLAGRPDARVEEPRRRVDAKPATFLRVKERDRLEPSKMRPLRMQWIPTVRLHRPLPILVSATGLVPISGSKLGIKNKLKTVVTGVLRDEGGAERDISDPNLITLDGTRVPVLSMSDAYKHLGVLRAAMGGDAAAADSLRKQLRLAIGRVARMHRPSREDMVLVTNGLFQGLAGFKCSTVYYSFEWMEGVEREWRKMFNRKARRDSSTPVCLLYEGGGGTEAGTRRHLWAIGCSAFYSAFTRALADRADTSQRAAARSALALSLSRWGIQGDPRLASWRHLSGVLEKQLRDGRGYLGDTFMFISDLVRDEHACIPD